MTKIVVSELEEASFDDYFELTKPKVVALMILTSIIGMFLSVPGMVPFHILVLGNVGIAFCAGSAAVINHVVDRKIDLKMSRTLNRPVARGRVQPYQAMFFSVILGLLGKNETSLEDRTISIESFDDDGNTIGTCGGKAIRKMHAKIQSTFSIQCNCRYSKTVKITVSEPVDSGNIKVEI